MNVTARGGNARGGGIVSPVDLATAASSSFASAPAATAAVVVVVVVVGGHGQSMLEGESAGRRT